MKFAGNRWKWKKLILSEVTWTKKHKKGTNFLMCGY